VTGLICLIGIETTKIVWPNVDLRLGNGAPNYERMLPVQIRLCQGWPLMEFLALSLPLLCVGVFFVVLMCDSFDVAHRLSNRAATG
jgi:hypothetical protein